MIKLLIFLITFFVSFLDKPEKSTPALSERAKEQRAKWNIQIDQIILVLMVELIIIKNQMY